MTVAGLLADAATRLAAAHMFGTREARLEARVLAAYAWAVDTAWLVAHDTDPVDDARRAIFEALVTRRTDGVPVAYLVGRREFYGRPFDVSNDVLIPRPDTERLVELALERIPADQAVDVLDLGTGSGCIALSIALDRPRARVTAVDRSRAALELAQRNARALAVDEAGLRIEWVLGDWFEPLGQRIFDVIVSNPPYVAAEDPHLREGDVRFEPPGALASGPDGLDDLRRLCAAAPTRLNAGGWLLLEHGYNQAERVRALLTEGGLDAVETWTDLAGQSRVSGGRKPRA